jgi:hypothetical protein
MHSKLGKGNLNILSEYFSFFLLDIYMNLKISPLLRLAGKLLLVLVYVHRLVLEGQPQDTCPFAK